MKTVEGVRAGELSTIFNLGSKTCIILNMFGMPIKAFKNGLYANDLFI